MKIWGNLEQGSEQWFAARTGKITASNAAKIITAGGKPSGQRDDYMVELISDCFAPGQNSFQGNFATDRGTALEPLARDEFALRHDAKIDCVGFVSRDDGVVGCSPDGLLMSDGDGEIYYSGLEIKCPLPKTHLRYLLDGILPDTYKPQVHFSMMVTGLPWVFWSYCPGMKPLRIEVEPDDYTQKLESMVDDFVTEYAAKWDKVKGYREVLA